MQRVGAPLTQRVVANGGKQQQRPFIGRVECAIGPQPAETHAEFTVNCIREQRQHPLVHRLAVFEERGLRLQVAREIIHRAHDVAATDPRYPRSPTAVCVRVTV
jgi:hypothetical protein